MLKRVMDKASFTTLHDAPGWDLGEIVACEGTLLPTITGEQPVKAMTIRQLVKRLRPLPHEFHRMTGATTTASAQSVDVGVTLKRCASSGLL